MVKSKKSLEELSEFGFKSNELSDAQKTNVLGGGVIIFWEEVGSYDGNTCHSER
ncbi:MAG: hypothetical protein AAFQ98_03050 [Bacteroidota bacterium]